MHFVTDLHVEYLRSPASFVAVARPRLSWRSRSEERDWHQRWAELRLTRASGPETVQLDGRESALVDWPFAPLESRERVVLEVRVKGSDGSLSAWSPPLAAEASLLNDEDWKARLVGLPVHGEKPAQFIRDLTLTGPIIRARLYSSARGTYEVEVNGQAVSNDVLAPGWTSYDDRIDFQTADVSAYVRPGANRIGIHAAGGWFTEKYGFFGAGQRAYAGHIGVIAQLEIEYADGRSDVIGTDGSWLGSTEGGLRSSSIYHGESFDARLEKHDWSSAGSELCGASPVEELPFDISVLRPAVSEPVRRVMELTQPAYLISPSGATIADFGQNFAGRVRIRVRGAAGDAVTLRHAEVLEHGELALRPLRTARATDRYIAAGSGTEEWEPRFTYHGFRYVQIDAPDGCHVDVTGVVCSSDMHRTGHWSSSEPVLDRLHENVVWSMRSNFFSIPSDCPQRDERLGWTGDLQLFAPTAADLFDTRGFLASWMSDVAREQEKNGGITPLIVPGVLPSMSNPVAAWGDVATIVPWLQYQRYADRGMLANQYASMRTWADAEASRASADMIWVDGGQIGDHLDPTAPPDRPTDAKTAPYIVASAYLVLSLRIVAQAATVLGHADDARTYGELAERARMGFQANFVTPRGRIVSDSQTSYALALTFDLVEPALRQPLGDRLAELVRENGYTIGTGFIGTPAVLEALISTGHADAASRLLLQRSSPSWLHPVTMGATTVWERWDSMLSDGSVNPGEMTSFNHYALGSVVDTLHRCVAGLSAAAPGYSRIRISPVILPGLDNARSQLETPYGPAAAGWIRRAGGFEIEATIPANTSAEVSLPSGMSLTVGSGDHRWFDRCSEPVRRDPAPLSRGQTDLATLIDDEAAVHAVIAVIAEIDPGRARAFEDQTVWKRGCLLEEPLMFADPRIFAGIDAAFDRLNRHRATGTVQPD